MKRAVFHPEAEAEMIASARWYDARSEGLGKEFFAEVEVALTRIAASPQAWGIVVDDIRQYLLDRFPFGILYRERTEDFEILAVMHLHREPGYWVHRV